VAESERSPHWRIRLHEKDLHTSEQSRSLKHSGIDMHCFPQFSLKRLKDHQKGILSQSGNGHFAFSSAPIGKRSTELLESGSGNFFQSPTGGARLFFRRNGRKIITVHSNRPYRRNPLAL
jgi:hypothetical protein